MGRVHHNLKRVHGFVDTLMSEIHDPTMDGPGTTRQDWERSTSDLLEKLTELDEMLNDWEEASKHE